MVSADTYVLPEQWNEDLKDENGEPMSKNEFKKRQKAARVAAEKAEKEAAKAAKAAAAPAKEAKEDGGLDDDSTEITDPTAYYENRVKVVNAKKAAGQNPYPHKWQVSISVPDFIAQYSSLEAGQTLPDVAVSIAGRLYSKRSSGGKLLFYDMKAEGAKIQVRAPPASQAPAKFL